MMLRGRCRFGWVGLLGLVVAIKLTARVETLAGLNFGAELAPREVSVYLPPAGVTPTTPVLVALDGQNLAAWRLPEAVSAFAAKHPGGAPLVVAIPSGADRMDEYGLAGEPDYAGRGKKAAAFQRFVIESVLPAVRRRYGVQADPTHTGVMGASLGGLTAFDLAWQHQEVFGFAGIFSGSLWWRGDNSSPEAQKASRLVMRLVRNTEEIPQVRLWFEAGTQDETSDRDGDGVIDSIQDTRELLAELERHGFRRGPDVSYDEVVGGEHNEATWAKALPMFLEWALPREPAN